MWFIYFAIYWAVGNFIIDWLYCDEEDIPMTTYGCLILIWPAPLIGYAFTNFFVFILECIDSIRRRR